MGIRPTQRGGSVPGEFTIFMKPHGKKNDSMRFSSDYTSEILTTALRFRSLFAENQPERKVKKSDKSSKHLKFLRESTVTQKI